MGCDLQKSLSCVEWGGTQDIWALLRKRGRVSREGRRAEPRHNCDPVTPNKSLLWLLTVKWTKSRPLRVACKVLPTLTPE